MTLIGYQLGAGGTTFEMGFDNTGTCPEPFGFDLIYADGVFRDQRATLNITMLCCGQSPPGMCMCDSDCSASFVCELPYCIAL